MNSVADKVVEKVIYRRIYGLKVNFKEFLSVYYESIVAL
jgi:hypothetical protein